MAILWQKTMSVGNDIIDHDHRYLISFVNTIELALQSPNDKIFLLDALTQLYEYGETHFRREEIIQRKIGYPQSLNHKHEHNKLLAQLKEVSKNIIEITDAQELAKQAPELIIILRGWLVDHVFSEDMLLKPYLAKHAKGLY